VGTVFPESSFKKSVLIFFKQTLMRFPIRCHFDLR
jgi:hypothetical protein